MDEKILRPWGTPLLIHSCDGSLTIANAAAPLDSLIICCGTPGREHKDEGFDLFNKPGAATQKAKVQLYEVTRWKNFRGHEVFNAFGKPWDTLCLTQHQMVDFVKKYPGQIALNGNGYTVFLLKSKNEYCVVYTKMQPFGTLIKQEVVGDEFPIWNLNTMAMGIVIPVIS